MIYFVVDADVVKNPLVLGTNGHDIEAIMVGVVELVESDILLYYKSSSAVYLHILVRLLDLYMRTFIFKKDSGTAPTLTSLKR